MQRSAAILIFPRVVAALLAFAWLGFGCASVPKGRAAVDTLEIEGAVQVPASDILEKLATSPSPKFFGLFRGLVFDYQVFDRFVFQRDLERVERFYRARGFYQAHARAGRVVYVSENHVRLTVEVDEGPPTIVRNVEVLGVSALPAPYSSAVRSEALAQNALGHRFEEEEFAATEARIARFLSDRGYAFVKVHRTANVDLPGHVADLVFDVVPGEPSKYGEVRIQGLGSLPEEPVRQALALTPGAKYSTTNLHAAQFSVLGLGVFSSAVIEPELSEPPPPDAVVPITVKLERTPLRALRLGGGLELDVIRSEVHGQIGWEDRNFLGGYRHLTLLAKPGVVFYPTRLPDFQKPTSVLPEARVRAELRQPGLFEGRTAGVLRGQFNVYPLILSPTIDPKAPVLGYREIRGAVGLDRTLWKIYVSPLYNFQHNTPFAYLGDLDPALTRIVISYVALLSVFDLRDDPVNPHKGIYVSDELQVAGGPFLGDARDLRTQPEVRAYVPLGRRITWAMRASVGFLFPYNYGDTLSTSRSTFPVSPDVEKDIQLTYFRGFFSGGPNSNRGYPLRGVAPHGIVPFACSAATASNPLQCSVPLAGLSLWEASMELRVQLGGPFSGALFVDSSDVSRNRLDLRLNHPHLSSGIGVRYDTPVGPIRLDVGYRIPGLQAFGHVDPNDEPTPDTILGLPIAVAFGIGEAF